MCVERRLFRKLIVRTDCAAVGRKAGRSVGLCIIRHCRLTTATIAHKRSAYKRQPVPTTHNPRGFRARIPLSPRFREIDRALSRASTGLTCQFRRWWWWWWDFGGRPRYIPVSLLKIYEGRAHRERAKQTVSIRKLFTITSPHSPPPPLSLRTNGALKRCASYILEG